MTRPDPTLATVFAQLLLDSLTSRERAEEAVTANSASKFCICCGSQKAGSRSYVEPSETFCRSCTRLLTGDQRESLRTTTGTVYLRILIDAIETITRRLAEKAKPRRKAS